MRQNKAKGIWCDNSWDRWLELYNANIYKKQTKVKFSKKISQKFSHMENESLYQLVVKEYMDYGYYRAKEKINELYNEPSNDRLVDFWIITHSYYWHG